MRLVLLGPPGSGKGTQAKLLGKELGLEHISTGDLLRAAICQGTPVGQRARPFVESGQLVPDEMVNDLIAERFGRADRPGRFVLDGYPRTAAQAAVLDRVLQQHGVGLTGVVLLAVPDEEIVTRLAGRQHLEQRQDDQPETVRARLQVYHKTMAELISHYRRQGLLREVSGVGPIEQIYANVLKALTPQAGPPC
jgi:adenylate kinase